MTTDFCWLAACAIHDTAPDVERVSFIDMNGLWKFARAHKMTAMIAMALEKVSDHPEEIVENWDRWKKAKDFAVRRRMLFDAERAQIVSYMEEQGIWYAPLKGIVIQDFYPVYGMREMADNDLLFDPAARATMRQYMTEQGYTLEEEGSAVHDTYLKKPLYNFELHVSLFSKKYHDENLSAYFLDAKEKMQKDEDNGTGWHYTDDDLYIYVTAHAYKHYSARGTGIRTITDNYVFRHAKADTLHWDYIDRELEKLDILEFDRTLRSLSEQLLAGTEPVSMTALSREEQEMLTYMAGCGIYGSMEHAVENRMRNMQKEGGSVTGLAKGKYLLRRLFPDGKRMKAYSRTAEKYPVLIPLIYVKRIWQALFHKRKYIRMELNAVGKVKKK
ncbi:MAG: nucleotidyltransferase family protein [Lachnospiraceae bacterium]|nr:nucleotidyltransferase family protein [Lachnospiraceae bacterium]